jgi:hypothetical protein
MSDVSWLCGQDQSAMDPWRDVSQKSSVTQKYFQPSLAPNSVSESYTPSQAGRLLVNRKSMAKQRKTRKQSQGPSWSQSEQQTPLGSQGPPGSQPWSQLLHGQRGSPAHRSSPSQRPQSSQRSQSSFSHLLVGSRNPSEVPPHVASQSGSVHSHHEANRQVGSFKLAFQGIWHNDCTAKFAPASPVGPRNPSEVPSHVASQSGSVHSHHWHGANRQVGSFKLVFQGIWHNDCTTKFVPASQDDVLDLRKHIDDGLAELRTLFSVPSMQAASTERQPPLPTLYRNKKTRNPQRRTPASTQVAVSFFQLL